MLALSEKKPAVIGVFDRITKGRPGTEEHVQEADKNRDRYQELITH
jgi:hypothetical protein